MTVPELARLRLPAVWLLFLLFFSAVPPAFAQDVPLPPAPTRWVTDNAGMLDPQSVDALDSRLRLYQEQTQHQLIVWIGKTTGDTPIEDWANRAFEKWGLGRKGVNDGLALFIMADDHKLRFEVGYGLEAQVPDLLASRILREIVTPGLRAGQPATTINQAMEAVAMAIGQPLPGSIPRERQQRRQKREVGLGQLIVWGIIALIALVVFATNPSMATWLLLSMLSGGGGRRRGGGGGWGGGGGGGFGGGGGSSGGGGASGSW